MSRFFTFLLFYYSITVSYTRYFDVCPARKMSIGACLAGLCPLGSECINNYCCKERIVTTTSDPETEEHEVFGMCKDGQSALGECISTLCPTGYLCEENLCCGNQTTTPVPQASESTTYILRAKTFTPSTQLPTTSMIPTEPITPEESIEIAEIIGQTDEPDVNWRSTTPSDESGEDTDEEGNEETTESPQTSTMDTTEIEIIRSSFRVLKSKESKEINEEDRTTTTIASTADYERSSEETEVDDVRQTSTQKSTNMKEETDNTGWISTTTEPYVQTTSEEPQICPIGASIGECISDQCPEGHTCFKNSCCIITPQINCTDTLKGCLPHLCDKRGYKEFTTANCAKTCARCHVSELTSLDLIGCRDRRSDCKEWAGEGFCESSLYSVRQKLKFCGKSCKLC